MISPGGARGAVGMRWEQARGEVARTVRALASAGLVQAFGHVSVRLDDGGVAISSTRPLHVCTPEDVVRLAADGHPVAGAVDDLPLETPLHQAIYLARPDVGAVARGHGPEAVAWGAGSKAVPLRHGLGLLVGWQVRVHPEVDLVVDLAHGARVAKALGTDHAVLLRANGALAVGADPMEAATRLHALEDRCRVARAADGEAPRREELSANDEVWQQRSQHVEAELRRACRWFAARYATPGAE